MEKVEVLEIAYITCLSTGTGNVFLFTTALWSHINILSSDAVVSELVDDVPV